MARSEVLEERDLRRMVRGSLESRLPLGWTLRPADPGRGPRGTRPDLLLEVGAPDGRSTHLAVQLRSTVEGRDIASLQAGFAAYTSSRPGTQGLVAARYLSPPTRARLTERGVSYVDSTGNIHVRLDEPALFVSDRGADTDPGRGPGRPRGTLKGAPAAAVVRAITDFAGAWTMRDLIDTSRVSTGAGYRVVDLLESEGLLERPRRGMVTVSSWVDILRRWSQDYSFAGDSRISTWIAPRGLPELLGRAAASGTTTYAVTGTLAAAQWAEHAPARSAMIYVHDSDIAARSWDLRPAEAGANVVLGEPAFDVPFVRARAASDGLVTAAPAQVAVDLLTGPGRNPAEAEELLAWMVSNEGAWRRGQD